MTKRIEELAKELGFDEATYLVAEQALEKFANLIIRDCLQFVEPYPGSGDEWDLALESAKQQIKDHFNLST